MNPNIKEYYTNSDLSFKFGEMKPIFNDLAKEVYTPKYIHNKMDDAAYKGDLKGLKRMYFNFHTPTEKAFVYAAERGFIDVMEFLKSINKCKNTKEAMEIAASEGRIDVIEYIYENFSDFCIECSAEEALVVGNFKTVEWFKKETIIGYFNPNLGLGHIDHDEWIRCKMNLPDDCYTNPAKKQKIY
jgi:hypothetical protein